jgi:NAD(P)-dependent dehydrogenase (short-subunit alcohol dehydrogenase family)
MDRREMLLGLAAAATSGAALSACGPVEAGEAAQVPLPLSTTVPINPPSPDYFTPDRFKGKTVIVTGCARGMGAGAAQRAAREGANVVGVDWIEDLGAKTIRDIVGSGGKATFVPGDVGDTATCETMVKVAVDTYGGLDMAINNAGVMDGVFSGDEIDYQKQKPLIFAPIHEATDDYWDKVFRTNSGGVFRSMRAELRQMVAQGRGGAIVNVASIAGMTGLAGNPAYVASKHAVNGLTRNAAIDYAPHGIRVNSVNMAATDTPMVARAGVLVAEAAKANPSTGPNMGRAKTFSLLAYANPNHRPATVAEQVSMMLFLLSTEASNFTGGVFPTDGGWTNY